jgi:hypothetical protein
MESAHFLVRFGLRNPVTGKGLGPDGIRDRIVALTYIESLEKLYNVMINPPWSRQPPIIGDLGRTEVYVFDTSPFTASDDNGVPFICLSSRSNEPTTQSELHRAAAEAVHEATHVFNFRERPFPDPYTYPWEWFDEGFAVFMETLVVAGNPDYCRFLMNWIDIPETSLDDLNAKYQAGMFIRYLAKRFGYYFINDVWTKSMSTELPFEALDRLMPNQQKFISSDPNDRDVFASGYCIDPYFLWDPASACLAPEVLVRYGERTVSETFSLIRGQNVQAISKLNHLACRYFRFFIGDAITSIEFTVQTSAPRPFAPLKAELAVVDNEMKRQALVPLLYVSGSPQQVSAQLDLTNYDGIGHLVLAVSNCGLRAAKINTRIPHDDGIDFIISVKSN